LFIYSKVSSLQRSSRVILSVTLSTYGIRKVQAVINEDHIDRLISTDGTKFIGSEWARPSRRSRQMSYCKSQFGTWLSENVTRRICAAVG